MPTIKQAVEAAMREIHALSEAEQASADQIRDGVDILRDLLAQWSMSNLMIPFVTRTSLVGDSTKASYSWGPGGDINAVAPVDVTAVSYSLGGGPSPLMEASETEFASRSLYNSPGHPNWFFFERQPTPILHFNSAPFGGLFSIVSKAYLPDLNSLTASMELPPEYNRIVRTNLAIEFCPSYEKEPSAALVSVATESKMVVLRRNATPIPSQSLELPGMMRGPDLDYGF